MLVTVLEMRWKCTLDERGTAVVGDLHDTIHPDNLKHENIKDKYKIQMLNNTENFNIRCN